MQFLVANGYLTVNTLIFSKKQGLPFDLQKVTLHITKRDTL